MNREIMNRGVSGSNTGMEEVTDGFCASAGCSKRQPSTAVASEEPRKYRQHFEWAVRPSDGSWRTEKPLK